MCGITGVFSRHLEETVPPELIERLVDALAHRGPDDRGVLHLGPVAVGVRRLSIIDVEGGHQPMSTADGMAHLVYNGETYNYRDLRRELESLGHRFRTASDTEVVLEGYREWGIRGLLRRLNGIYGFALWDAAQKRGFLCRDRLGVKPLYYVDRNGRLAFSSELRALALSGLLRAKIDDVALWGYLTYQFSPDERTLLAGARKVPPGHFLEWHNGDSKVEKYWDFPDGGELESGQLADYAEQVRALLWDAVERQMMSDVPIGCFLSGGLDSSIVAALMARLAGGSLKTYSIAFPDYRDCDETEHFERVAREIGATHQTITFSEREVLSSLARFAWAADEPVADPAMLPTYLLSEAAAREVKVVLTGEGADEVFAGYPYYRALVAQGEAPPRAAGGRSDAWKRATAGLWDRLGRMVPAPRIDLASRTSGFPYAMDAAFLWHLLAPHRRPEPNQLAGLTDRIESRALADLKGASRLQAALALDTKLWLANDLMPKLDKMTMAHSLEGRVPFLDHRLVELAFRLPTWAKVDDERGKVVLRDAVAGLLPEGIVDRRKQGFNVPLCEWFRGPLSSFVRETLLSSDFAELGIFDKRALEALVVAHTELDLNVARPLWQTLCLGLWMGELERSIAPHDPVARPLELSSGPPSRSEGHRHRVDIVVPVYDGVHYVRDLLRTIERNTEPGSYRVFLIDDSANDATHEALGHLVAAMPRVSLHRNARNEGFVASCNTGMALGAAPYVGILNSDTLVGEGWLERMLAAAESDETVAVVNPVSNKAVNLSVPLPPGYGLNTMSRKVREVSRHSYPDITTAVGFCMLIRRRFLDWLGGFDPVYGPGYCEESDLCMRYTEAGLRVVAADDAFVYHRGCGSFGTWLDRYHKNRAIFDSRWEQEYARDYARFLARNPLQDVRDALLRHTVARHHWSALLSRGLDEEVARRRLRSANRLARQPSRAVRKLWAAASDLGKRADRWASTGARPRTGLDPEQRQIRYPTAAYIDGIPAGEGLRITFLVAAMPVCGGIISIVQLAREFMLRGHDVVLATTTEELEPERFNLPTQPLVFPDRETLLRLFPPSDVVIATYWTTAYDYLAELRRRYSFVSVYFIQDYEAFFYDEEESQTRHRVASTYALAQHRIVKSRWLQQLIASRHGLECEIVPLGLDLGIFHYRPRGTRPAGPPRILTAARPDERRRGFTEAVKAFRRIHRARPEVEFVFFGTPDNQMPRGLDIPYTNVGRLTDQREVAELLSTCDVLVDPSLFQAFGRPGLEAMACGTNCVLTSEGGLSEYARNEENCLLVPPGDPEALARATLRLLDDSELRQRLRQGGLRAAQRFSHVEEARRHLELYRAWIEEGQPAVGLRAPTRSRRAVAGAKPRSSAADESSNGLSATVLRDLRKGRFAFIDAGCASGGSIAHCEQRFGRRPGLGLDWYEPDLERARQHGHTVARCDLLRLDLPPQCVGFSSMMDVLEHLPNEATARRVIEQLARASRDFLFIRHPSFEDMEYLGRMGLKLGWTDWSGHPNMMRMADFRRIFDNLGWRDYEILPDLPIYDSGHPAIVPASAPVDSHEYDEARHGPKPYVEFDRVLYGQYCIFVRLNPGLSEEQWYAITAMEGWRALWESSNSTLGRPPAEAVGA